MEDEHIKGSPFDVSVKGLDRPVKIVNDLKQPSYIAIDKTGSNVIVTEGEGSCFRLQSNGREYLLI